MRGFWLKAKQKIRCLLRCLRGADEEELKRLQFQIADLVRENRRLKRGFRKVKGDRK